MAWFPGMSDAENVRSTGYGHDLDNVEGYPNRKLS